MFTPTPESPFWKPYAKSIGNLPGKQSEYVLPNSVEPIVSRNASLVTLWNPAFLQAQAFANGEDANDEITPTRPCIEAALAFRDLLIEGIEPCLSQPSDATHAAAYGGSGNVTINMGPIRFKRIKEDTGNPWPWGRTMVEMMLGTLKQIAETKQKQKKFGIWPNSADVILKPWVLWARTQLPPLFGTRFTQADVDGILKYFSDTADATNAEGKSTKGKNPGIPKILSWTPGQDEWKNFNQRVMSANPEGNNRVEQSTNPDFDPDIQPPLIGEFRAIELDGQYFVGRVEILDGGNMAATLIFDNGERGEYSFGSLLPTEDIEFDEADFDDIT